jgi:hypothetical protein
MMTTRKTRQSKEAVARIATAMTTRNHHRSEEAAGRMMIAMTTRNNHQNSQAPVKAQAEARAAKK